MARKPRVRLPRNKIITAFSAAIALAAGGAFLSSEGAEAQPATQKTKASQATAAEKPTKEGRTYGSTALDEGKSEQRKLGDIDNDVFHAMVLLDRAHFSPGVIDGREGRNFTMALKGYQEAHGLEVTGELDTPTRKKLLRDGRKPTRFLRIDETSFGSPFKTIPDDPTKQADLERMPYEDLLEEVAERFHTTRETLIALNGDKARNVKIGTVLQLPNVLPAARDYGDLDEAERDMFNALNVQPDPGVKGAYVTVDESDKVLRVYDDADKLIAQFPVTTGSQNDPLPLGDWKATTYAYLPPFDYQPDLFWDVADSEEEVTLPPGPNGPVGVAWLDLTKEHYGIHGTPEPQTIGYAESHGCIRLTNWDVLTLTRMLEPGFRATFKA
ncbi:L,D-transpeptidase family protein [Sphingomicrobium astaxanthinifaciens]|uniref:L,D-transpeptidase family protein n=1 Tax=Sphingomicrobium astaxanthinifaciens TaxID=1227949 RepID=UPI001FCBE8C4|nr:L,D-transpeptidase family protein [Sphingomicrobium astaxanthinifaciens]MCJ7422142.1 L,D-transpeptidase family protein [Sphingomicrobium astaxanthinifaciens]